MDKLDLIYDGVLEIKRDMTKRMDRLEDNDVKLFSKTDDLEKEVSDIAIICAANHGKGGNQPVSTVRMNGNKKLNLLRGIFSLEGFGVRDIVIILLMVTMIYVILAEHEMI